jgi:hypothetical protein
MFNCAGLFLCPESSILPVSTFPLIQPRNSPTCISVMLAFAIIMNPDDNQNEELDEWVGLAEHLVRDLGRYNVIAHSGAKSLAVVRRRIHFALRPSHTLSDPIPTSAQYGQLVTDVLAQPQPSLSDLLGQKYVADSLWTNTEAEWYVSGFPGIEALCTQVDPEPSLHNFFDNYLA